MTKRIKYKVPFFKERKYLSGEIFKSLSIIKALNKNN